MPRLFEAGLPTNELQVDNNNPIGTCKARLAHRGQGT